MRLRTMAVHSQVAREETRAVGDYEGDEGE